jgi:tetratricopeptide (TPR) repeat protein
MHNILKYIELDILFLPFMTKCHWLFTTFFALYIFHPNIGQSQDKINQSWINTINPAIKSGDSFDIISFAKGQESNEDHDQVQEKLDVIIQLIDSGQYDQALSKTNFLLGVLPNYGFTHYLRGICYQGGNKYDSAAFEFRKVFKTKDFELYGEVRIKLGQIELELNNLDNAREEFQIADNLLPQSPLPRYLMGMTYLLENKATKAKRYFDEATEVDSSFYPAYLMKAIIHLSNDRVPAASKVVSKLIESDSTNYEAFLLRGMLCATNKKAHKCMDDYHNAILLQPQEPAAYGLLGYTQLMADAYKVGIGNISKNIELRQPEILKAKYFSITIKMLFDWAVMEYQKRIDDFSPKIIEHLSKGILSIEVENFDEAKYQFEEALKQDSNNGITHLFLGIIYDRVSSIEDHVALGQYNLALESLGESTELLYRIAYINAYYKKFSVAADYMSKVVALNKDNYNCIKELGDYYFKAENLQKAYSMYSIYLHFNQLNKSVLLNRAQCYYAFSSIEGAIKDLEAAIGIDSMDYEISSRLTTMYLFNGDTLKALTYNEKVLNDYDVRITELNEKNGDGLNEFNFHLALKELKKEIMLSYNIKGVLHSEIGEIEKAIQAYDEGLSYFNNLEGKVSKGVLLHRAKQYEKAIKVFDEILKYDDPREVNSLYYKGLCLISINKEEEGNVLIKKASDLGYKLAQEYRANHNYH